MIIQKEEWLPDLTKKNIGHPVQFASQINTAVFVFVGFFLYKYIYNYTGHTAY